MGVAPGSVRRPAGQSSLPAEILPGYSDSGRNTGGTGLAGDGGPGPGCGRAFDLLPVQVPLVRLRGEVDRDDGYERAIAIMSSATET